MANVLLNLGGLCEDQARYAEAETHYRRAADIMTALPTGEAEDVDRLHVRIQTGQTRLTLITNNKRV